MSNRTLTVVPELPVDNHSMHTSNTGKAKPVPTAWAPLITGFTRHLTAIGRPHTTVNTRRQQLERMARALAPLAPAQVTRDHLTDYLATQAWALDTRRGHRNAMVAFFAWASETARLDSSPAAELPLISAAPPAPRPTPERVVRAIAPADDRTALMLRLATELGLRRAEVAVIRTDDVTDGDCGAMLRVHGKGGKTRVIPISDEIADLIESGPAVHSSGAACSGWLFPGRVDGHLSPRRVGELCADAMPGVWTMHTLRHRFATRAFRGSKNLRAVQELLGHTSVATTQRYTAVNEDEMRTAMTAAA